MTWSMVFTLGQQHLVSHILGGISKTKEIIQWERWSS